MTQETQFLMIKGSDARNVLASDLSTFLAAGWTAIQVRYGIGTETDDADSRVLMVKGSDAIWVRANDAADYELQGYSQRQMIYGDSVVSVRSDGNDLSFLYELPFIQSADLLLDLQADTLVLADDAPVSTWADQSGNGRDFTATLTARPTKQTDGGYPTVSFDDVDDVMTGPDFADDLDSFAVFYVFKPVFGSGAVSPINKIGNGAGWAIDSGGLGNGYIYQDIDNDAFAAKEVEADVYSVVAFEVVSRTEVHMYVNGSNSGESAGGHGTPSDYGNSEPVKLSGAYDDFDDFFLQAMMIYSPAPNASDRAAIIAWLAARYGITL